MIPDLPEDGSRTLIQRKGTDARRTNSVCLLVAESADGALRVHSSVDTFRLAAS